YKAKHLAEFGVIAEHCHYTDRHYCGFLVLCDFDSVMLTALHLMNEQDTQSVIAHLRAGDHLRAAITIRRSTGCGLKEAVLVLKGMIRELGLDQSDGESEMGMSAEIMAMGPFSRSIVGYLEYPEDFYKDTREGVVVLRRLFTV